MDFNQDFIPLALRTESEIAPIKMNRTVFTTTIYLATAIGNLTDKIKKRAAYNKPINVEEWNQLVSNIENNLPFIAELSSESFDGNEVINVDTRLFHGIIGLFTESTELMEALYDVVEGGSAWDLPNLGEEIGDAQWYQAILVDALKANMSNIQQTVIDKLKARYPQKYTDEAAINRDLTAERAILEAGVSNG